MLPLSLPGKQEWNQLFTHVEVSPNITQSDLTRPDYFPS